MSKDNISIKEKLLLIFLLILASLAPVLQPAHAIDSSRPVIIVDFDLQVDPGSSLMVRRAVNQAISENASAIIIKMNTPGGFLNDMTTIVSAIADANDKGIPTYTYIPPNSLGASAGSYIALACNKILMGEGSVIGPSTPEVVGGTPLEENHTTSTMLTLLVGLAEKWGHNTTAATKMVVDDQAYSTNEAVKFNVVDGVANSLPEALTKLGLANNPQEPVDENLYEQFIGALSNPILDGALILIGVVAIVLDIQHGSILLTIIGAVSIISGLIGIEVINASILGFVIIAISAVLIFLELKLAHGFALMAGVILGAFGILYLANGLSYSPSPITQTTNIEILAIIMLGVLIGLYFRWVIGPIRQKPKLTGTDAIVNQIGVALTNLSPNGEVRVDGIIWRAKSSKGQVEKGQAIRVKDLDGLVLLVEKEEPSKKNS